MEKRIHKLMVLAMRLSLAGLLAILAAHGALRLIEAMVATETAKMVAALTASESGGRKK